jgi:hypothetical protein
LGKVDTVDTESAYPNSLSGRVSAVFGAKEGIWLAGREKFLAGSALSAAFDDFKD